MLATAIGRKRRGEGHTRREEILSAAKELFSSEGYESVTLRRIAERVGVSAPTIYLYFPDKEVMLLELCDRTFNGLIARFKEIVARMPAGRARLTALGRAYIQFGLEHPDEYRLVFLSTPPRRVVEQGGHRAPINEPDRPGTRGAVAFAMMVEELKLLAASGTALPHDPETCAELSWMVCHGIVVALITKPDFPWSNRETLISGGLEMLDKGLLGRT